MKQRLILFIPVLLLLACSDDRKEVDTSDINISASADGKTNSSLPEIKFEEEVFDFGKITQGEVVSHDFTFKNIGNSNLIISGASGSCGCTVPKWPQEPILPGKSAKLNVVFTSEGKKGLQEKTITVATNCEPATRVIRIKADVIVAESVKEPGF